jgi:serine/threonine-protein kinase HipA
MGDLVTVAAVNLWGRRIGAVSQDATGDAAVFEFDPAFLGAGVELSPIQMPVRRSPYAFPAPAESFRGLPGMLADSLPDDFGNAVIDAWLSRQGREPESLNAVERLCYIGARGMGALEYEPTLGPTRGPGEDLQVSELVKLASDVLAERDGLSTTIEAGDSQEAIAEILLVGSSAGGARPKAVIAYDPQTGAVRSGQLDAPPGFEHWLLKFDGVDSRREVGGARGYGAIEFAYANMARAAGVRMADCRLLEEGGRRHFMTRRFDRSSNSKLHMQSLAALQHFDFKQAGAYSYEQALLTIRQLKLSHKAVEEQFRRMVFNIVARNQDDHVKNIAFLMNQAGQWALSPAFDMTYAYNPRGRWTRQHQMSMAGKRNNFTIEDIRKCAETASLKRGAADHITAEVTQAVANWPTFAQETRLKPDQTAAIARTHRLDLLSPTAPTAAEHVN